MAAIRDEPAMADAGLGEDACRPVILPVQLAREKIPVNFLLFTGKPGFAPSQVVPPCPAPGRRSECRLMRRHQAIAAVICWQQPSWLNCATIFEVFRKRSQLPRTKPTGKTVVKAMFGDEQHVAS